MLVQLRGRILPPPSLAHEHQQGKQVGAGSAMSLKRISHKFNHFANHHNVLMPTTFAFIIR